RVRGQHFAEVSDGAVPVRLRKRRGRSVQPGLELSQGLIDITRTKIDDTEVDIRGGRRRQQGNGALQAQSRPRQVTRFTQGGTEKSMAGTGRRIETNALSQ